MEGFGVAWNVNEILAQKAMLSDVKITFRRNPALKDGRRPDADADSNAARKMEKWTVKETSYTRIVFIHKAILLKNGLIVENLSVFCNLENFWLL